MVCYSDLCLQAAPLTNVVTLLNYSLVVTLLNYYYLLLACFSALSYYYYWIQFLAQGFLMPRTSTFSLRYHPVLISNCRDIVIYSVRVTMGRDLFLLWKQFLFFRINSFSLPLCYICGSSWLVLSIWLLYYLNFSFLFGIPIMHICIFISYFCNFFAALLLTCLFLDIERSHVTLIWRG